MNRIGCEESIVFKGQVESPMEFYSAFDMFLMISREESFSLVLEEAASLRKPIILFRGTTGASDWLGEDAAIYVPYFDVSAVADSIYALWSDPQKRKKLGDAAYEDIRKLYSTESSMDNIIDEIKSIARWNITRISDTVGVFE